jgi:hypothetical protein
MTELFSKYPRVLAVDPTTKGFAYAVFEGPTLLIDWGLIYIEGQKRSGRILRLTKLIERYASDVLVLEDCNRQGSRRRSSARRIILDTVLIARANQIRTKRFPRSAIKRFFSYAGQARKHEIAVAIAEGFPELAPRLPRFRKIWMSEDERMSIFDAASLALVYYGIRPKVGSQLSEAA